jgi:hypothetical protein
MPADYSGHASDHLRYLTQTKEQLERLLSTKKGFLFLGHLLPKWIERIEKSIARERARLEEARVRPKPEWPNPRIVKIGKPSPN